MLQSLVFVRRIVAAFVLMYVVTGVASAQQAQPIDSRTADQMYKSIQVLKGTPAAELILAMHYFRAALGVTCEYCHVEGNFPSDVKKPKEDFFAGKERNCRYDHFTMSGGKIDAALTCPGREGETMNMAINGTYARGSYEATMAMDVTGGPQGKGMKLRSRSESHRIGQCTAEELKAKEVAAK